MLFAITCQDRPGASQLRLDTRPAHLDYLERNKAMLVAVGPLLDGEGKPAGSLLVIEAPDQAAAEAFARGDPYAAAGLFARTEIRPFRMVFKDGARVA